MLAHHPDPPRKPTGSMSHSGDDENDEDDDVDHHEAFEIHHDDHEGLFDSPSRYKVPFVSGGARSAGGSLSAGEEVPVEEVQEGGSEVEIGGEDDRLLPTIEDEDEDEGLEADGADEGDDAHIDLGSSGSADGEAQGEHSHDHDVAAGSVRNHLNRATSWRVGAGKGLTRKGSKRGIGLGLGGTLPFMGGGIGLFPGGGHSLNADGRGLVSPGSSSRLIDAPRQRMQEEHTGRSASFRATYPDEEPTKRPSNSW